MLVQSWQNAGDISPDRLTGLREQFNPQVGVSGHSNINSEYAELSTCAFVPFSLIHERGAQINETLITTSLLRP